jgi:hypothetical protein
VRTISKTVEHVIRMGDYENVKVTATYSLEIPDGVTKEAALDEVDEVLRDALDPVLKEARQNADPNSYIHDWRN